MDNDMIPPKPSKSKATIPPIVRKGQKRPYTKATNAEIQQRIELIARAIGDKQLSKMEVHKLAADKWGVHWVTTDRYMILARNFLRERAGKTKDAILCEAVIFNEGILRSSTTTTKEKQDARRELNELFGIYPPRQIHQRVGNPDGTPMAPAVIAPVVKFIIPDNGRGDCGRIRMEVPGLETAETNGGNGKH